MIDFMGRKGRAGCNAAPRGLSVCFESINRFRSLRACCVILHLLRFGQKHLHSRTRHQLRLAPALGRDAVVDLAHSRIPASLSLARCRVAKTLLTSITRLNASNAPLGSAPGHLSVSLVSIVPTMGFYSVHSPHSPHFALDMVHQTFATTSLQLSSLDSTLLSARPVRRPALHTMTRHTALSARRSDRSAAPTAPHVSRVARPTSTLR